MLEQAPQGSGHGTELPEFEKHLDNALNIGVVCLIFGWSYVESGAGLDPCGFLPTWGILCSLLA